MSQENREVGGGCAKGKLVAEGLYPNPRCSERTWHVSTRGKRQGPASFLLYASTAFTKQ